MEGNEIKKVFFIYTQKGDKNNIFKIERSNKVKEVKELSKDIYGDYIQVLYFLEITKYEGENKINISLLDNQGEIYISSIPFDSAELLGEDNLDIQENIIYKMKFKPYNNNEQHNLEQFILPYDKQYAIFESTFKDNNKIMLSLYLNTITQVFLDSNEKFEFILEFFLNLSFKVEFLVQNRLYSISFCSL